MFYFKTPRPRGVIQGYSNFYLGYFWKVRVSMAAKTLDVLMIGAGEYTTGYTAMGCVTYDTLKDKDRCGLCYNCALDLCMHMRVCSSIYFKGIWIGQKSRGGCLGNV